MDCRHASNGLGILGALMAGALVLIVSGCEQKPVPGAASRKMEPDASKAAKQVEKATKPGSDKFPAAVKNSEDAKLAARISEALVKDPALKDTTIDVSASDGAVELFGTVDDTGSRVRAGQIASGVPGVKTVKNHLVIVKGS